MKTITRWIAELLFARELEEDYQMGIRYGQEYGKKQLLRKAHEIRDIAPKGKRPGIEYLLGEIK
jgi:hypothetical protein